MLPVGKAFCNIFHAFYTIVQGGRHHQFAIFVIDIGVNEEVVLDIVQQKLPNLKVQIEEIVLLENKTEKADF